MYLSKDWFTYSAEGFNNVRKLQGIKAMFQEELLHLGNQVVQIVVEVAFGSCSQFPDLEKNVNTLSKWCTIPYCNNLWK